MNTKPQILIIDAEPTIVRNLEVQFQRGYTIYSALNGSDGVEKVIEISPDLILLDIRLPDIDGYQVCKKLRSDPSTSETIILMLTAFMTSTEDLIKGFKCGADDYLTKPYSSIYLEEKIKALLNRANQDYLRAIQQILPDQTNQSCLLP